MYLLVVNQPRWKMQEKQNQKWVGPKIWQTDTLGCPNFSLQSERKGQNWPRQLVQNFNNPALYRANRKWVGPKKYLAD